MTYRYQRRYLGPLKAAILDWAGTVVDHGCLAPPAAFVAAFAARGVPITHAEARAPMGMAKRAHILAIIDTPRVRAAWIEAHGAPPSIADGDAIYEHFLPLQREVAGKHAELIPGALDTIAALRARGMKIGTTTGYPRTIMEVVCQRASEQGYEPDCVVAAEDTPLGRPGPFPALKALIDLQVAPVEAVVKIGDTVVDVEEGLNAGMWTIAITETGNEVGLSLAEWQALAPEERRTLSERASRRLQAAGAHYVAPSLSATLPIIAAIEARLAAGEKP